MDWLIDNPILCLILIILGLTLLLAALLLVSYCLEHFGSLCDKFNEWVIDKLYFPSFIVFGIMLVPIYIATSFFGYLGKLCDTFNRLISENSDYIRGEGWVSIRKRVFSFLLSMICLLFVIAIITIIFKKLLD